VNGLIETIRATPSTTALPEHKDAVWTTLGVGVAHGDAVKSPFTYAKLFFALVWNFVTSSVYVFYILILLVLFKIIRFIFGFFF